MLSIAPTMGNPLSGATYFEEDSYYLKEDKYGEWHGKGADLLGLKDAITRESFIRTLNGVTKDGEPLVKNAMDPQRNAYLDLTFSAPKSVSLLSYRDKRIDIAHKNAVKRVLNEIEKHYSVTRKGAQGIKKERTNNLVFARFNHHENRNLDPQLHTHCLVMNLTQGRDKKWRTIDNNELFTNKMFLGQFYRNELADELKRIGYSIEITDRLQGTFDIAGVDKNIIEEFSTRRKEVMDNLKKYEDYSCSESEKKQYACLDSRVKKADTSRSIIREETQIRLSEYDTSLENIVQKAQRFSEEQVPKISKEECVKKALLDVTENESAFRREKVIQLALKYSLGVYTAFEIEQALFKCRDLVILGPSLFPVGKSITPDIELYTTDEIKTIEQGIIKRAKQGKNRSDIFVKRKEVEGYLKDLLQKNIKLTKGQKSAVLSLCTSKDTINILQGDAGSGKTFAVEHIQTVFNKKGITVRGFAPIGKAADELSSANIETSTVDSFLEKSQYGKADVNENELWIVDESSMMGSRKMAAFLEQAKRYNAKVVLIGDSKQLHSIGAGKIFEDLQKLSGVTFCEMTEIQRQKTADMRSLVTAIKEKRVADAFVQLLNQNDITEEKDEKNRIKQVAQTYLKDREQNINSIIVTGGNKERNTLNQIVRSALKEKGTLSKGITVKTYNNLGLSGQARSLADSYQRGNVLFIQKDFEGLKKGTQGKVVNIDAQDNIVTIRYWDKENKSYLKSKINVLKHGNKVQAFDIIDREFSIGDTIIFLKNDKLLGVKNSQLGTITELDDAGNAKIQVGKKIVECNISNRGDRAYNYLDYGYALTSYKSQGATVDKAIISNNTHDMHTNINDLYVKMTRAKYDVQVYTDSITRMQSQSEAEQIIYSSLSLPDVSEKIKQIINKHKKVSNQKSINTLSQEILKDAKTNIRNRFEVEKKEDKYPIETITKKKDLGMDL